MKRWFITPDLHGNRLLAEKLLRAAGVPLVPAMRRVQGIVSVQLGDLANCVAADAEADERLLALALDWYDVVLVGNHELPYFGGPRFAGFWHVPEVEAGLLTLERRGRLKPCLLPWRADVLLTHAGVSPGWGFESATEAADAINAAWEESPSSPLISQIGRSRGGAASFGGITWSDFREEPRAPFRQIHGHTPMRDGPTVETPLGFERGASALSLEGVWALNLDVDVKSGGKRIVGAWLDEDGAVELVEATA